nr:MAG TPA: hypothetical protein [Caudoviricetes sp.]
MKRLNYLSYAALWISIAGLAWAEEIRTNLILCIDEEIKLFILCCIMDKHCRVSMGRGNPNKSYPVHRMGEHCTLCDDIKTNIVQDGGRYSGINIR